MNLIHRKNKNNNNDKLKNKITNENEGPNEEEYIHHTLTNQLHFIWN